MDVVFEVSLVLTISSKCHGAPNVTSTLPDFAAMYLALNDLPTLQVQFPVALKTNLGLCLCRLALLSFVWQTVFHNFNFFCWSDDDVCVNWFVSVRFKLVFLVITKVDFETSWMREKVHALLYAAALKKHHWSENSERYLVLVFVSVVTTTISPTDFYLSYSGNIMCLQIWKGHCESPENSSTAGFLLLIYRKQKTALLWVFLWDMAFFAFSVFSGSMVSISIYWQVMYFLLCFVRYSSITHTNVLLVLV